mmetsp:Transcript_26660/g.40021  ORF Transcript_26660/g.40021 Transcript_26660/m.40021 type:complete len:86 (+) Transcript_26660:495-752(+)
MVMLKKRKKKSLKRRKLVMPQWLICLVLVMEEITNFVINAKKKNSIQIEILHACLLYLFCIRLKGFIVSFFYTTTKNTLAINKNE